MFAQPKHDEVPIAVLQPSHPLLKRDVEPDAGKITPRILSS